MFPKVLTFLSAVMADGWFPLKKLVIDGAGGYLEKKISFTSWGLFITEWGMKERLEGRGSRKGIKIIEPTQILEPPWLSSLLPRGKLSHLQAIFTFTLWPLPLNLCIPVKCSRLTNWLPPKTMCVLLLGELCVERAMTDPPSWLKMSLCLRYRRQL